MQPQSYVHSIVAQFFYNCVSILKLKAPLLLTISQAPLSCSEYFGYGYFFSNYLESISKMFKGSESNRLVDLIIVFTY